MSTEVYRTGEFHSLTITRFNGGETRGVLAQITLGSAYVILTPREMRDMAATLIETANYAEGKE